MQRGRAAGYHDAPGSTIDGDESAKVVDGVGAGGDNAAEEGSSSMGKAVDINDNLEPGVRRHLGRITVGERMVMVGLLEGITTSYRGRDWRKKTMGDIGGESWRICEDVSGIHHMGKERNEKWSIGVVYSLLNK